MEKKLRKLRMLKRKRSKSFPDMENLYVRLGSLAKPQSKSLEKEEEEDEDVTERKRIRPDRLKDSNVLTDDLDNATADMMAMFRNVSLDSECSSARSSFSSIKSKYSIQFETETDNSDDDELGADQFEEELRPNFPGDRRFSMIVGQNTDSRYHLPYF